MLGDRRRRTRGRAAFRGELGGTYRNDRGQPCLKVVTARKYRGGVCEWRAPVTVVRGEGSKSAAYIASHAGAESGVICFDEYAGQFGGHIVETIGPADDKGEQARRVFDALRRFDSTDVKEIWAQCPDEGGIGLAVNNRLNKAAGFHIIEV